MTDFNAVSDVARALHNVLASDIRVQNALGLPPRLYDDPPEDPIFPYLTYGPIRSEDNSADGARLTVHLITLHLWSRYSGRAEALELMGMVAAVLTDMRFNARTIDVTDSESLDAWRELLPGAGVKSAEISGAGVFRDKPSDALARGAFFAQAAQDCQFIMPEFGKIEGMFLMSSLSYAGTYQGEASFEMSLVSAGALSFSA